MDTSYPEQVRRMPRRNNWTASSDEALVDLLLDESIQSGTCSGSFRPEAWHRVWNLYQRLTNEDTSLLQLKGRWKTLKKQYRLYASLVNRSGWSWDLDGQKPNPGSPVLWDEVIQINKEYKVCREKPFPLYTKMHDLVASSTATGQYARCSGEPVRRHAPVVDLDEGSGSSDSPEDASDRHRSHGTKRKQAIDPSPSGSNKKSSNPTVEALNRLASLSDQRGKFLEETKKDVERYSLETCLEKLEAMPGLSDKELLIAARALKCREERIIFLTMRPSVIDIWLSEVIKEYYGQGEGPSHR